MTDQKQPPLTQRIRERLHAADDGLTAATLARVLGSRAPTVIGRLKAMPDAYIDRWIATANGKGGRHAAVWCVVEVPADCPPPDSGCHGPEQRTQPCA